VRAHRGAAALFCALLAACAGLPPKHKPVQLSQAAPLDGIGTPGGGDWPAKEWWKRYRDPTLDQLIDLGGANSPSLASAHARYDSARQSVRLAAAESGAHLQATADADRQRLSDNGVFPPQLLGFTWYDQYDLGLQASYTFDWWGKQRDAVQAAMDQAHAAQADSSAAALMLASSIADAYFGWQSDQNRLLLAREKEIAVELQGKVSGARVQADLDSADELNSADLALAAAREQIAMLEGSAKLRVVVLAALVGCPVSELPPLSPKPLPSFPGVLPDNVKIDLIARRADITASRWRVEAAERSLASARADFFPDISVNAMLGFNSIDMGKLLEYGSRVPQITGAIHLPIFDAGKLKARYGCAQAAIDSAPPSMWPAGNAPIFAGVLDSEPQAAAAEPSSSNDQNAATPNTVADPQTAPTVALAQQDNSNDGRDAWFEEVLATLGGALAAGLVAWFLFGAPPQRMYG